MILNGAKRTDVISNTDPGQKVNIDSDSMHILQMLLAENLYQDPVSAVVNEYSK